MKKNIFKFGAALTAAMMVFSAAAMLAYAEGDEVPAESETVVSDVVEAPVEETEDTEAPAEDAEVPEDEEAPADEAEEVVIPVETEEITNEDIEAAAEVETAAGQVDADGSVIEIGTIAAAKATDYYEVTVPFTVQGTAPSQMTIFVYDITGLVSGTPDATVGYKAETPVGYINQDAKNATGTWDFKLSTEKFNDDSIIVVKLGGTDIDTPDAASVMLSDASPAPDVKYGDANGDGKVNGLDAALVMRYYRTMIDETQINVEAADAWYDGKINGLDAATIMRYYRTMIDSLPQNK